MTNIAETTVDAIVADYRNRVLNRRDFLTRLISAIGSMAAAHTLLETSGLAATTISERESQQAKVSSATMEYPSENNVKVSGY